MQLSIFEHKPNEPCALEIRTMIYEALLVSRFSLPLCEKERDGILPPGPPVRILEVSRSIYRETRSILYGQNTFNTGLGSKNTYHINQWLYGWVKRGEEEYTWPIRWDNKSAWDDMKDEVREIFNYHRKRLRDPFRCMQLPSFLRGIGPSSTGIISRLCFDVCGIFSGVNQCLLWLEFIRQHMPVLKVVLLEFSKINSFDFDPCEEPSDMSKYVDQAVEALFRALKQHLEYSPIFAHVEIAGEPTLAEMATVLVVGKRTGRMQDVMDIWKERVVDPGLLEVYHKYRHIYLPEWAAQTIITSADSLSMAYLETQDVLIEGSRSRSIQARRCCAQC